MPNRRCRVSDPTGFLKFERKKGSRRPVKERLKDWKEFENPPVLETLQEQSRRCMDCGVPFCQGDTGCPVDNIIPDWNELVMEDRWEDALRSLHSTNNFPEFTGKLCPAPCESACVLGISDDPVTIKNIELSIVERGFRDGTIRPVVSMKRNGKKVAVVGSGPAGLAAAQQLARLGYDVNVYEKADAIGGLLRYGIPDFKMEKDVLDRRLKQLEAEGVQFTTGFTLGVDGTLAGLRKKYDAVCLATGAEVARDLPVPGRNLPGVHFAMDYLIQQNRRVAGKTLDSPSIDASGKHVIILGGGDTGSDCLGTALRQGAASVHQFELQPKPGDTRDEKTPWPLWPLKLRSSHAHEEGGDREWSISTTELVGDASGVKLLRAKRLDTGKPVEWKADLVLLAMGFTGTSEIPKAGLSQTARTTFEVTPDFQTNLPGVFAAGDATRGASLIVWAIADGRKMAAHVDRYLSVKGKARSLEVSPDAN
jgi:glutamate synthase (NADPH) small chain